MLKYLFVNCGNTPVCQPLSVRSPVFLDFTSFNFTDERNFGLNWSPFSGLVTSNNENTAPMVKLK